MTQPSDFVDKYVVEPSLLPSRSLRRPGRRIDEVRFLVAHDTGNEGSTAAQNVAYYRRTANAEAASAHLFVDDRSILECVPALTAPPEVAWHVRYDSPVDNHLFGADANDAAIGVEYCFGPTIDADEAYRRYVWVLAKLCYEFQLDPCTAIVGHFFLDPARRTDPNTGLARSRRTYEQLLRDVPAEYDACLGHAFPVPAPEGSAGTARPRVRLNLRRGEPTTRAPVVKVLSPGEATSVSWLRRGRAHQRELAMVRGRFGFLLLERRRGRRPTRETAHVPRSCSQRHEVRSSRLILTISREVVSWNL